MGLSTRARTVLDALVVASATALFTYIGFLLIAGISHDGDSGGGRIITGVVLLFPWFAAESAIHSLLPHGSPAVSLLTTAAAVVAQFLYYLAIYWVLRRVVAVLRHNRAA